MQINREISVFQHGVQNMLSDEIIAQEAASDALNWVSQDGRIQLVTGKIPVGALGVAGSVTGEIFGYKANGTTVHWRKIGTKIQYLNNTTWTDVVTGLTSAADYSFANYSSLAGTFTYAFGVDGIYKFHNAVPASYNSMYDSAKNYKGKAIIDKGRSLLWDRVGDKTGLYGSCIDAQNSTVYTTVAGEATTSLTGTLAFKGGGATRNCFGVTITLTASGEVYTDNYLGVLTGNMGGTGTINYISGAYTITNAGVGTAGYQWEDSNIKGVTDFITKSSPRTAGQAFQFPQDQGGDPILNVLIGANGYYSIKGQSAYLLTLEPTDLSATNEVYRVNMGSLSYRGSYSTAAGIVFINTSNQEKPECTVLVKNIVDGTLEPKVLFPTFKFANYLYDDCMIGSYERYIVIACKTKTATNNDTLLLCNLSDGTVSITNYAGRTFSLDSGNLYLGSSVTQTVYKVFNGYDDDGFPIQNYWISKGENYSINSRSPRYMAFGVSLKKFRKVKLRGYIDPNQSYAVYHSYDGAGFQLIGTVLGSGSYVDLASPLSIGSNGIGTIPVGGGVTTTVYPYYCELRLKKMPKFRKRYVKFVALGYGYVDISNMQDFDLMLYEEKIPARFRQKSNVSLDGTKTNLDAPQF
jgi:hypothetical protein